MRDSQSPAQGVRKQVIWILVVIDERNGAPKGTKTGGALRLFFEHSEAFGEGNHADLKSNFTPDRVSSGVVLSYTNITHEIEIPVVLI